MTVDDEDRSLVDLCDNARWVSVAVRLIWGAKSSCSSVSGGTKAGGPPKQQGGGIFTARYAARMPFISRMPKSCLSPLSRNHCSTAPPPRSRKTAPSSNSPRPSTSSCHCRAPPHHYSRILPLSSKRCPTQKKLLHRRKTRRSGGPSDPS